MCVDPELPARPESRKKLLENVACESWQKSFKVFASLNFTAFRAFDPSSTEELTKRFLSLSLFGFFAIDPPSARPSPHWPTGANCW